MNNLNLVCLDFEECSLLTSIEISLAEILSSPIILIKYDFTISDYFQKERGQYDAGKILSSYDGAHSKDRTILLTSVDLYIPIFTFVFGLARLDGDTGIVSVHRLKSEFYGLPPDPKLLQSRLQKEIVHEYGHLLNLRHCHNYYCVMASTNTADDLDVKGDHFCKSCLFKIAEPKKD